MTEGAFSRRTDTLLKRADAICEARGARLTALRRQVLGLVLDSESPAGAYELLDRLRATRMHAAECSANTEVRLDEGAALVEVGAAEEDVIEHGGHSIGSLGAKGECRKGGNARTQETAARKHSAL